MKTPNNRRRGFAAYHIARPTPRSPPAFRYQSSIAPPARSTVSFILLVFGGTHGMDRTKLRRDQPQLRN